MFEKWIFILVVATQNKQIMFARCSFCGMTIDEKSQEVAPAIAGAKCTQHNFQQLLGPEPKFVIPGLDPLTTKQELGAFAGSLGAACSAALAITFSTAMGSVPALLCIGVAAAFGTVVGSNQTRETDSHRRTVMTSGFHGACVGLTTVKMASWFQRNPQSNPQINSKPTVKLCHIHIEGPHFHPCPKCGTWLEYVGEPHYCSILSLLRSVVPSRN